MGKFNEKDFSKALILATGGDEDHLSVLGFFFWELRWRYVITEFDSGEQVAIDINSSIEQSTGLSSPKGENSIRAWIVDQDGKPLGSKTQKWVTRENGWEKRLDKMLGELISMAVRIELCVKCGRLQKVFITKKGKNKGRKFLKCCTFEWLDKPEASADDPVCPKCASAMALRSGKFGDFWGCSSFPSCRGTRNITSLKKQLAPDEIGDLKKNIRRKREGFTPSAYQKKIFDWVQESKDGQHLVVRALAGSGKTTTGLEMLTYTRGLDVLFVAFNKAIQMELQDRAPSHVRVLTYHALGFKACREAYELIIDSVDQNKVYNILNNLLERVRYKHIFGTIRKIVSLVKANLSGTSEEELLAISDHYGIELNGDTEVIFDAVRHTIVKCAEQTNVVDFDDMCWLPIFHDLPMKQYDVVFIDECLPYKTPVHLADGSYREIGDIVENKLPVEVLSYNEQTGEQEVCKVINWHKISNSKKLVKVRVRWSKKKGTNIAYSFVTCTDNHKIWTPDGYVEAGKLFPGTKVQVETAAYKLAHYKITKEGRNTLSKEMLRKNAAGITGTYKTPKGTLIGKRGGNGQGLSEPQAMLLAELGDGWEAEYAVKTKLVGGRDAGYPYHYKVDIADPVRKIAVEIDGESHRSRLDKDIKKENCLKKLGWKIYRYSNVEAVHDLYKIAKELEVDCPILAEVVSVEESTVKDYWVYDITVDKCHNFYANSILVHNCQDTNRNQIALALKSIKDTGRIIAVGDDYQSMYGFRGADVDAIPRLIRHLDAEQLPLSITYRCPQSHVRLIKQKFPHIPLESWDEKGEGEILYWKMEHALVTWKSQDMVLCRTNAPLVRPCFDLIRRGIKATIRGRDIGKGLIVIIRKMKADDVSDLIIRLVEYRDKEIEKLLLAEKNNQAQAVEDKVDTIIAMLDGVSTITELEHKIESVFSDRAVGVVFSTVHRAKGLQAERVSILRSDLMPHPMAEKPWQLEQENNINYVALTRSLETLVFVN